MLNLDKQTLFYILNENAFLMPIFIKRQGFELEGGRQW